MALSCREFEHDGERELELVPTRDADKVCEALADSDGDELSDALCEALSEADDEALGDDGANVGQIERISLFPISAP